MNSTEILRNYNAKLTNVTFQVRSCDDASCSDGTFAGPSGVTSYYTNAMHESLVGVDANRYFQYEAFLDTNRVNLTPKLYNVTIRGHTPVVTEDVSINNAWIDFNHTNYTMSGGGLSWSYVNTSLLVGGYTYRVYAEDSFGNVNVSQTRTFTVPSYDITFNVTSGEDGSAINNIDSITCDYSGYSKGSDTTSPYGPYEFPVGSWSCIFEESLYYTKTLSFNADMNKIIDVVLEEELSLTNQEHDWLADMYNCLIGGDCNAYNLWQSTNQNVSKIWQQFLPTDEDVVLQEETLSNVLTETNDISINYTIAVPYKEGYDVGTSLPIMVSFWFTDASGKCYNQDKQTSATNRAESPYCIPLIAEYLGPNNGTVSFKVDLHPNLPDGNYEIVRSIDIDPPVNGQPVWINYGRENIGSISVVNKVATAEAPTQTKIETVEAKAPTLPRLNEITGGAVEAVKSAGSISILIGLTIICLTIFGVTYIRTRR